MKFKVTEVPGDEATYRIPLSKKLLEQLGWQPDDILKVEIPMIYEDQLIIYKAKETT